MKLLGERTITRRRFGADTNVNGILTPGATTDTDIRASVATLTMDQRARVPESMRSDRMAEVISYTELRNARPGQVADRLIIDSETWEVVSAERYPAFMGEPEHWEAMVSIVQPSQVRGTA